MGARRLRAVLLGVTPGIATMRWPSGTSLLAVDWADGMLQHVWPRVGFPDYTDVVRADWRELPLADGSVDLVVGDGCYSAMSSLADARQLNQEMRRVLQPRGWYCLRSFCRSERTPSVEACFAELDSGRVQNLDLFRWRLAMAVHGESRYGVVLGKVWRIWQYYTGRVRSDPLRWSEHQRVNMARWEGVKARFLFPSRRELQELAEPGFDLVAYDLPAYESAEHFPRLLMRARRQPG